MRATLREAIPCMVAAATVFLFVAFALEPDDATEAAFASAALMLVVAACAGPFATDGVGPKRAAVRCGLLGVFGGIACLAAGHSLAALSCGLFSGLYACALGLIADMLPGRAHRVVVAMAGLAVLATLHVWDDLHLLSAEDRKASADLAFHVNPAAAVSVTLDYDWIHASELYRNNQTAESMFGLELGGVGRFASILLVVVAILLALRWKVFPAGRPA